MRLVSACSLNYGLACYLPLHLHLHEVDLWVTSPAEHGARGALLQAILKQNMFPPFPAEHAARG